MLQFDLTKTEYLKKLKIIDFGFSVYQEELKLNKTACGTLNYIAPEVYKGDDYDY